MSRPPKNLKGVRPDPDREDVLLVTIPFHVEVWKRMWRRKERVSAVGLCAVGNEVALVMRGDRPYVSFEMVKAAAKAGHEAYEERAHLYGYETREGTRVAWEDLPEDNRCLMLDAYEAGLRAALEEADR